MYLDLVVGCVHEVHKGELLKLVRCDHKSMISLSTHLGHKCSATKAASSLLFTISMGFSATRLRLTRDCSASNIEFLYDKISS